MNSNNEDQRLQLLYTLQSQAGTTNLDILELLSYEDKKDFKGWRDTVITSLCSYIEKDRTLWSNKSRRAEKINYTFLFTSQTSSKS